MKIIKATPFLAMGTMALGLVGATFLAPVANANSTATQKVSVNVASELGLEKSVLDEVKSNDGKNAESQFKVKCNSANGFKLTLTDKDDDTSLRLDGDKSKAEIKTLADITSNPGWNVTGKDGNKHAIPATGTTAVVIEETAKTGDVTAKAHFNFNTDSTIQAGEYSDVVEYSLVANPAPVASSESH